jgi:ankyrin repeat protein
MEKTIQQFGNDLELIPDIDQYFILESGELGVSGITHLMKLVLASTNYPQSIDLIKTYDLLKPEHINVVNSNGQSAFYLACIYCNIDVITMLIDHGANVNTRDIYDTPILIRIVYEYCQSYKLYEARQHWIQIIALLINSGADVNCTLHGYNILYLLVRESNVSDCDDIIRLLIDANININYVCRNGETALHTALWYRPPTLFKSMLKMLGMGRQLVPRYSTIKLLLDAGIKVDHVDTDSNNALHLVSKHIKDGKSELINIFELLISTDPNLIHGKNKYGLTPLNILCG